MTKMLTDDPTELAAHELAWHLGVKGIPCFVHWDRSPWGVRIPLTSDLGEYAPALYVLTENIEVKHGDTVIGVKWFGQLGNFGEADLTETTLEWIERKWLGFGIESIADAVEALLPVLRHGASV